jgi:hypothetical protein
MREICKSGSMRGSGRPASNAPATLYSTGSKKPRKRDVLRASGGRALVPLHRKELKERKDSGVSREGAEGAGRAFLNITERQGFAHPHAQAFRWNFGFRDKAPFFLHFRNS